MTPICPICAICAMTPMITVDMPSDLPVKIWLYFIIFQRLLILLFAYGYPQHFPILDEDSVNFGSKCRCTSSLWGWRFRWQAGIASGPPNTTPRVYVDYIPVRRAACGLLPFEFPPHLHSPAFFRRQHTRKHMAGTGKSSGGVVPLTFEQVCGIYPYSVEGA